MKHQEFTPKQQKALGIASIIICILFSLLVISRIGIPMVKFASEPEKFRLWVDSKGVLGRIIYIGMVVLQVMVAIIPGEPFEIAGGYAFGSIEGTILCLTGSFIGSMLVFFLVRKFGIKLVEIFFSKEKLNSLRFLKVTPKQYALYILIFTLPGTPKDLLCYFAGLTDMKLGAWLIICSVCRLPSIITSTIGGDALGSKSYLFAIIVFAVTLIISFLSLRLYQSFIDRHSDKK